VLLSANSRHAKLSNSQVRSVGIGSRLLSCILNRRMSTQSSPSSFIVCGRYVKVRRDNNGISEPLQRDEWKKIDRRQGTYNVHVFKCMLSHIKDTIAVDHQQKNVNS